MKSLNSIVPKELVIADIGNSRTKILTWKKFHVFDNNADLHKNISEALRQEKSCYYLIYSSVNKSYEKQFHIALDLVKRFQVINVKDILKKQTLINFNSIKGIGDDRMLGLLGATAINSPPLITVDCGTAVTVNLLDKNYNCLGGAIFAGAYTQMSALHSKTGKLPNVELKQDTESPATNTEDAINLGIQSSIIGGIKELSKEFIAANDGRVPIFITGGYGELIMQKLQKYHNIINYRQHLVLEGILHLYREYYA